MNQDRFAGFVAALILAVPGCILLVMAYRYLPITHVISVAIAVLLIIPIVDWLRNK